jgi:NADH-quinone oxidoreductase subunit B
MHGILRLRKLIQDDPELGWRQRYDAVGTEEIVPAPDQAAAINVALPGDTAGA